MWTCDYSSSYKGSLTKHIASVHNAKKSFKCDICDPIFYKKKHIVKVHESKKPVACNVLMLPKLFKKGKLEKTYFCSSMKSYLIKKTYSFSSWRKNQIIQMQYLWSIGFNKSTSRSTLFEFILLKRNGWKKRLELFSKYIEQCLNFPAKNWESGCKTLMQLTQKIRVKDSS